MHHNLLEIIYGASNDEVWRHIMVYAPKAVITSKLDTTHPVLGNHLIHHEIEYYETQEPD